MPILSVIIPIYNSEKYLKRCLESVICQSLSDLEVICVDDGSVDSSLQIIEEYERKDSRIKVIHKENGGLVSARKTGLSIATGEYIGYVDSDDWIDPNMYEVLYTYAARYKVDLVTSGYFMEGDYVTEHYDTLQDGLYQDERMNYLREHTIYNLHKRETGLRASLCPKLFSYKILEKAQMQIPDEVSISEDKMCLITYILECQSVYILKEAFYHYIIHQESMVHKNNPEFLVCINELYKYLLELYKHNNFSAEMRKQTEIYMIELLVRGINTSLGFQNRNLLWTDPYWINHIPQDSQVVLYGGGELGEKYQRQILSSKKFRYICCVDFEYKKMQNSILQVKPLDILQTLEFDYLIITTKNRLKADKIRKQIEDLGISPNKILWFEQREIFWKYMEADGLLGD